MRPIGNADSISDNGTVMNFLGEDTFVMKIIEEEEDNS